jgi:hypothetical protein
VAVLAADQLLSRGRDPRSMHLTTQLLPPWNTAANPLFHLVTIYGPGGSFEPLISCYMHKSHKREITTASHWLHHKPITVLWAKKILPDQTPRSSLKGILFQPPTLIPSPLLCVYGITLSSFLYCDTYHIILQESGYISFILRISERKQL